MVFPMYWDMAENTRRWSLKRWWVGPAHPYTRLIRLFGPSDIWPFCLFWAFFGGWGGTLGLYSGRNGPTSGKETCVAHRGGTKRRWKLCCVQDTDLRSQRKNEPLG